MISIKLNKLLDKYHMNISELSESTGIARSTLTPLIKKPNEIKGLRMDTVNTLCEFFGSSVDELLEFHPNKHKYKIFNSWIFNDDKLVVGINKSLGSKSRKALLLLTWMLGGGAEDKEDIKLSISSISTEDANKFKFENLNNKDLIDGSTFTKDLFNQSDEVVIETSRILGQILLNSDYMNSYPIMKTFHPEIVTILWMNDSQLVLNNGRFIFEVTNVSGKRELTFVRKENNTFDNAHIESIGKESFGNFKLDDK